jgi:hypothetical protein
MPSSRRIMLYQASVEASKPGNNVILTDLEQRRSQTLFCKTFNYVVSRCFFRGVHTR